MWYKFLGQVREIFINIAFPSRLVVKTIEATC